MPASETVDFEREFEELVRELRALPADARTSVRERVRALGEPEPRRVFPQLTWRRAVVVLVPACLVAVVAAAAVHGLVSSSASKQSAASFAKTAPKAQHAATGGSVEGAPQFDQARQHPTTLTPLVPTPSPGRYQNYQADLRVRVKDLDALGDKTARAMQITQQLGGFVASMSQSSTS